ncbi:MAG: PilZ domain-containing protein [Terracidiphilus sp.]
MSGRKGWLGRFLAPNRADRRPASGFVGFRLEGSALLRNAVRDISATGAYLVTREHANLGALLSLTMQHEGPLELSSARRITTLARVVRVDDDGMGIEFVVPADDDARRWSALIENLTEQARPADMLTFLHMVEAVRFLSRMCPQASEDFEQLFRGRLSNHKIANAVGIANRAESLLAPDSASGRLRADPALILRILEVGSCLDEEGMRNQWAGLLSVCCRADGQSDADLLLVDLFAQLTTAQVRMVTSICAHARKNLAESGALPATPTGFKTEDLAFGISLREAQIERDLEILSEIGLVRKGFDDSRTLLMSDMIELAPTDLALELHCRCHGHRGNPEEFYQGKSD